MSEQPVQQPAPQDWARAVDRAFPLAARRPRVVVKADLLPALGVASTTALIGFPLAWVWSRIAPALPGMLDANGHPAPLPSPFGYHRFDDLAIFMLIGLGAGLATGIAMWMLRELRGPVILIAGVLGSFVAAWLTMRAGLSFAAGHYALSSAPRAGVVFLIAPELETRWGILAQPLGCAIAYGVLAAWNSTNDLGRRF